MPGLAEDVSDVEDVEAEGRVNALQNGDTWYFCKKTGHQKRECRKFDEWKKKNPHKEPGGNPGNPSSNNSRPSISCYNCGKEGHISWECRGDIKDSVREISKGFNPEVSGSLRPNRHKNPELQEWEKNILIPRM